MADGPAATDPDRRRLLLVVGGVVLVVLLLVGLVLALTTGDDPDDGASGPSPSASSGSSGSSDPTSAASPSGSSSTGTGPPPTTGAPGPTGSPTIPGVVEDPATVPASRVLLCDVTAPRIAALLGPDGAGPDTLRIGSDALLQLLPDWRDGADGYPLADDRIGLAEQVGAAWERAVAAYDAGDTGAAEGFTGDAEDALTELEGLDPLPGC